MKKGNKLHLFPTLRVGRVEVVGIAECYGRTAATESQQFTLGAFLKALMLAINVHLIAMIDVVHLFRHRADITLKTAARHQPSIGRDSKMTVAAVATIVDRIRV